VALSRSFALQEQAHPSLLEAKAITLIELSASLPPLMPMKDRLL
jgi:hypothetical protein